MCDCCKGGSGDSTVCVAVARVGLGIAPCVWLLQGCDCCRVWPDLGIALHQN